MRHSNANVSHARILLLIVSPSIGIEEEPCTITSTWLLALVDQPLAVFLFLQHRQPTQLPRLLPAGTHRFECGWRPLGLDLFGCLLPASMELCSCRILLRARVSAISNRIACPQIRQLHAHQSRWLVRGSKVLVELLQISRNVAAKSGSLLEHTCELRGCCLIQGVLLSELCYPCSVVYLGLWGLTCSLRCWRRRWRWNSCPRRGHVVPGRAFCTLKQVPPKVRLKPHSVLQL
mmetsp:Transcript_22355/g.51222  ORF Transcript_22355/g.51222 Transcript_22355/m.51222 type:complete len:233 (-) Transcript_22355:274-972(-)